MLFRLERLGHDLTQMSWERSGHPASLFAPHAAALPASSLLMLHAGMGLAFGERLVGPLRRHATGGEVATAMDAFAALCRDNALPGYAPIVWEPLGIMVRLFHPRWTIPLDRALVAHGDDPRLCFWHGVGRANYFLPRYFWPGATPRALARCRREPPDEAARVDALAGFVFAAAMVNLRHPAVLERMLAEIDDRPGEEAVIAGAVAACALARHHTTPDDPALPALLAHRPAESRAELWRRRVREPVTSALEVYYAPLVASGRLPQLARHRDLPAFMAAEVANR